MVGDEAAQRVVGVLDVPKVTGAVERVQAGVHKVRGVADIVQPSGGFKEIGVIAEDWREAPCLPGDALAVRPTTGKRHFKELAGDLFGPGGFSHVSDATR
ncbi:hypothetical protein GCM10010151_26890 [Actinoallomurus spadix]|uniref:Uncharacterized protein n=1 Tax=Actinoallomurus spadix TaxID=79912 RepID=A0ABN0WG52_9ACTN